MKTLPLVTIAVALVCYASTVSAQDIYDWPSAEAPVMVRSGDSVLFVGKDKTVWRTYRWKPSHGKNRLGMMTVDMDADGKPNVIGAGKPLFVLDHNAVPMWTEKKGCDQVLVANVIQAKGKELICIRGSSIKVYAYDGQFVWGVKLSRIDYCNAGDVNGDLLADIECKHRGAKTYSRFDGATGDQLALEADASMLEGTELDQLEKVNSDDILSGKTMFDFDGDGTAEENLLVADGKAIVIQSRSKKGAVARIETKGKPLGVIVKDLDGDKKLEIIIVTKKHIFVSDHEGKKVTKFGLNARSYKRQPIARMDSVYATGFADDAQAKVAVEGLNEKLAKCYSGQVRKNQFAGQGKVLLQFNVDEKGKAKSVSLTHTDLPDKKVVKCAQNVLKKGKYPAGGDGASVNVHLFYTFRDE